MMVLVTGGFDPLHGGHIKYFQAARKLAWQQVSAEQPKVAEIKEEEREKKAKRLTKTKETFQSEIQVLQRIYK